MFTATSRRKLNLFIPLRKMSNFLFSKMWHLPSLLKTILSQALSQHLYCLHCNDLMIWITSTGKTLSKAPKHSDLQSWIRVLSYLPKLFLFYHFLFLGENWHHLLLSPQSSLSPIIPGTKLPWHWVNPCLFQFSFRGEKTDKEFR